MSKHPVNIRGTVHRADNERVVIKHRHTFVHVFHGADIPQDLRDYYAVRTDEPCSVWAMKNAADQFVMCKPKKFVPISIPFEERSRA